MYSNLLGAVVAHKQYTKLGKGKVIEMRFGVWARVQWPDGASAWANIDQLDVLTA